MSYNIENNENNRIFNFNDDVLDFKIRCIQTTDNSICMNAEDICIGFGWVHIQNKNENTYTSIRWSTINTYCKELGFTQQIEQNSYIPEPIFYMLAMKANNQKAFKFQQWIAFDVLPSIRKYGIYINKDIKEKIIVEPSYCEELLDVIEREEKEKKELKNKLKEQEIFIEYANIITNGGNPITYDQMASLITGKISGYIDTSTILKMLRDENIINEYNLPYQKYIDEEYFIVKERWYMNNGNRITEQKVLITQKGQVLIFEIFKNKSNN